MNVTRKVITRALFIFIGTNSALLANATPITTPQAVSLTSAMESLGSLLYGMQYVPTFQNAQLTWNSSFSSSAASISVTGNANGIPLNVNYSGNLSGTYGAGNLSWTGNWTGLFDSKSVTATDTATWIYDSVTNAYTSLNFAQDGEDPLWHWLLRGTEVLGGVTIGVGVGSVSGGWPGVAAGVGATAGLLTISQIAINALTPPVPPPPPPLPPIIIIPLPAPPAKVENIFIDGSHNNFKKKVGAGANTQNININGDFNCIDISCSANGTASVPEPSSLSLIIIGATLGLVSAILRRRRSSLPISLGGA